MGSPSSAPPLRHAQSFTVDGLFSGRSTVLSLAAVMAKFVAKETALPRRNTKKARVYLGCFAEEKY